MNIKTTEMNGKCSQLGCTNKDVKHCQIKEIKHSGILCKDHFWAMISEKPEEPKK